MHKYLPDLCLHVENGLRVGHGLNLLYGVAQPGAFEDIRFGDNTRIAQRKAHHKAV